MNYPSFDHASYKDFEEVYEPSEDSFLLLDAIEADLSTIQIFKFPLVAEIGFLSLDWVVLD